MLQDQGLDSGMELSLVVTSPLKLSTQLKAYDLAAQISVLAIWHLSISHTPVNVLPKTSSSGGTSSFGVVLFVIDNFDMSMPCNVAVDPEPIFELYIRLHCQLSGSFDDSSLLADEAIDPASIRLDWRSILLSNQ